MDFSIEISAAIEQAPLESQNEDVRISLSDGRVYVATFFTLENVRFLMQRYKTSGECSGGLYFWASDMILVESLSVQTINSAVADLLRTGEIDKCLTRIR